MIMIIIMIIIIIIYKRCNSASDKYKNSDIRQHTEGQQRWSVQSLSVEESYGLDEEAVL